QRGSYSTALAPDREALAIRERILPAGHPAIVESLVGVTAHLVGLGPRAPARPYAERAVAAGDHGDHGAANARWLLSRLLGPDARERALALARDARQRFAAIGSTMMVAEIDAWLAANGASQQEVAP